MSLIKDLDPLDRERLVSAIQKTARRLGTPLGIRIIREMIRYRETEIETPEWLAGWVFLTHTGQFYHRLTGQYVESSAFDKAFGRYVAHGTTPTWFATRVVKIPVYHMTMYLPGAEGTFRDASGVEWINTYRDTAPPIPIEYSEQDIQNIRIVKNHALHLFGEDQQRDIDILHSILAYIVQTGKRVNWITAIQGAEKIGKTFYAYLLSSVLGGAPHIHMLDTETLTNSSFTEWAQGHQVIYIEELKVHGRRYDVMDKLKPYITNESVSIHPKGKPQYNAVNTTTYLAFTNYRNAVPVGEGDTRYFILLSHWQKEVEVKKFKAGNPDYYNRLFAALHQSPGALRRWLMEYELHPDFDPVARAPHSEGKLRIIDEAKSELQTQIEDLIDAGDVVGVSKNFIVVHLLRNAVADESGALPPQQSIQSILQRLQYTPIKGRRVKITDTKQGLRQDFYCWSDDPEILRMDQQEVRAILEREILARLSPGLG